MLRSMDKSKLSPLVVIDPIQKERNAAAALSKEKFNLFGSYHRTNNNNNF